MKLIDKLKGLIRRNGAVSAFAAFHARVKPGLRVFEEIEKKYGGAKMFLCPYAGTGDVYLACMYMNAFASQNDYDNFVVLVIGQSNYKIAQLFGFKQIEKIDQKQADCLVRLYIFLGSENGQIILMHHQPPQLYCGILENMRNINGLHFVDLYTRCVFNLDPAGDMQLPQFHDSDQEIDRLFAENRLIPGRTVVLAPYVNTLPSLPWWVWCNLADKLLQKGYVVCTNVASPSEAPVNGTIPLRFGYDISVPLLEKCGYFVGVRSGFCDIISSASCKKIIVYQPYLFWGEGTNFDYFSLNRIGFCDDAIELEYEGVEFYDLIDEILDNF